MHAHALSPPIPTLLAQDRPLSMSRTPSIPIHILGRAGLMQAFNPPPTPNKELNKPFHSVSASAHGFPCSDMPLTSTGALP